MKKTSIVVAREEKQNKAKAQRAQAATTNNNDNNQRRQQRDTDGQAGGNRGRQERREGSREEPASLLFSFFLSPGCSIFGRDSCISFPLMFNLWKRLLYFFPLQHLLLAASSIFLKKLHLPKPNPPPPPQYPFVNFLFVEKCKPKVIK
jgi:hypothetical protein